MPSSSSQQYLQHLFLLGIILFTAAFFFSQDAKGQRIVFFTLLVVPFLILNFKTLFTERNPYFYLILSYFFLLLLSLAWSVDFHKEDRIDKIVINTLSTFLFFHIFYTFFKQYNNQFFYQTFALSALVCAAYSLFTFYSLNNFPTERLHSMIRDLHPNITGAYFAIALVFFLKFGFEKRNNKIYKRIFYFLSAAFLCICILFTHSRGAILILAVGMFTFSFLYKPKLLIIISFLMGFIGLFYWYLEPALFEELFNRGTSGRNVITRELLDRASGYEMFGRGIASKESIFWAGHAHSSYLSTYLKLGIVGLSIYLSILLSAAYCAWSYYRNSFNRDWLPLVWLAMGATNFIVEGTELIRPYHIEWVQFWLPVALCLGSYHRLQSNEKTSGS